MDGRPRRGRGADGRRMTERSIRRAGDDDGDDTARSARVRPQPVPVGKAIDGGRWRAALAALSVDAACASRCREGYTDVDDVARAVGGERQDLEGVVADVPAQPPARVAECGVAEGRGQAGSRNRRGDPERLPVAAQFHVGRLPCIEIDLAAPHVESAPGPLGRS